MKGVCNGGSRPDIPTYWSTQLGFPLNTWAEEWGVLGREGGIDKTKLQPWITVVAGNRVPVYTICFSM